MPMVATSPSTFAHSCDGMYFSPSITAVAKIGETRRQSSCSSRVPSPVAQPRVGATVGDVQTSASSDDTLDRSIGAS